MSNQDLQKKVPPPPERTEQSSWRRSGRGYFGEGMGKGESPYTSFPPRVIKQSSRRPSPYTKYGPILQPQTRPYGFDGTPYTHLTPVYRDRSGSGESPYTDFGPIQPES